MPSNLPAYVTASRSLKFTRDSQGALVVEFHTNGGPFTFTAQDHTELVEAFYRISQDRANKIVILTGAAGEFIPATTSRPSATLPIPLCGAKCTMKVFRSSTT